MNLLFPRITRKFVLWSLVGALAFAAIVTIVVGVREWRATEYLREAMLVAEQGEQWWPVEMRRMLYAGEDAAVFKSAYAKRVAKCQDSNVAAEGMLMLLRHPTPDAASVIAQNRVGQNVNQYLYSSSEFSALCLSLLEIQRRGPQSEEERALLKKWKDRSAM